MRRTPGFTLIELLIVVAIVGVLAAIATVNLLEAKERALKASNAANMKAIAAALQFYYSDYNHLPPGDRKAGPFPSHTANFAAVGDGPAGGGSWDGVPWLLVELRYIADWRTLFNPKYLQLYRSEGTVGGEPIPRFHNFRYAWNSAALASGGHLGGTANIESGETWLLRDLWIAPQSGFYGSAYPDYPADFEYPWGHGKLAGKVEHVMNADLAVREVVGGTNRVPDPAEF